MEIVFSLLIGAIVGLVSSVLGLGGGAIIVPLLPLVAQVSPRMTIGTSLLTVFLVSGTNSWRFHKRGEVNWPSGLLIGAFAAVSSYLAATITGYVSTFALHAGMALVLTFVAVTSFWPFLIERWPLPNRTIAQRRASSGGIGIISGLIAGFTGVGGGVIVTPMLARLKTVVPAHVVPTANASIMLTALAGTLALVKAEPTLGAGGLGLVRLDLAAALYVGALLTSSFGRSYQSRLDPRKRDWLMGAILIALTVKTFISAYRAL